MNNMPPSIENTATERLARQIAARTLAVHIEELLRRVDALPILDSRPEDEILGYCHHGLPSLCFSNHTNSIRNSAAR